MKLWQWWLIVAGMWLGWSVFQFVNGPVWWALIFDISLTVIYVSMAVRSKKKLDRRKV